MEEYLATHTRRQEDLRTTLWQRPRIKATKALRERLHPVLHEVQAVLGSLRVIPGAAAITVTARPTWSAVREAHGRRQVPDQQRAELRPSSQAKLPPMLC